MIKKWFSHWTAADTLLFVLSLASMEYFWVTRLRLEYGDVLESSQFFSCVATGFETLAFFIGLLALETYILWLFDRGDAKPFRTTLLMTHLPWVLGFLLTAFVSLRLPDPHNDMGRKFEILLGIMWMTHLFIFTGWLFWKRRGDKSGLPAKAGWAAAFLFVGAAIFTTTCDLSGDEPHYLLMAHSLLQDGDLDLSNNYENGDYKKFYHRGALEPQGLEHNADGKRYSHHPLGPVLLILPGFWLFGRLGAALTMALLAALALYFTLRTMEESGAKGWPLWAVAVIGLFSSPLFLFSGLVFPEIPTAFLVALSLFLFRGKRWLPLGLVLGLMIWMHNRNVLIAVPFFCAALWEVWKTRKGWVREALKLYAGFKLPALVLMGYFYLLYGVFTPLGAHNEPFTSLFHFSHFWNGFFGLLLDQECGLWFHFPIFAMAVMGGVVLWKSGNPLRFATAGVFSFYFIFMSFYENLGLTPATRYMVGVTPLLLFMMCPALEKIRRWDEWAGMTLFAAAVGVGVNWILAALPWMRYNKLEGENWILKIVGSFLGLPLTSVEPAFNVPEVAFKSYAISAFWVVTTILLTVVFLREKRNRS